MRPPHLQTWLRAIRFPASKVGRLGLSIAVLAGFGGGVWAGAATERGMPAPRLAAAADAAPANGQRPLPGIDLDGDGRLDVALPADRGVRGVDAYGSGAFGAARDGGRRAHHGVDLVAAPGEAIRAPIAGVVTRIGAAYGGSDSLRYVEIVNPVTRYTARVLYLRPLVRPGALIEAGDMIGQAQDLGVRYPAGMTNHVHVEFTGRRGARLDPLVVLPALPASLSTGLAAHRAPAQARHG